MRKKTVNDKTNPIPFARDKIISVLDRNYMDGGLPDHVVEILEEALILMYRRPAIRSAPKRVPPLSEDQKAKILIMCEDPDIPYMQMAINLGTNIGRISEFLHPMEGDSPLGSSHWRFRAHRHPN